MDIIKELTASFDKQYLIFEDEKNKQWFVFDTVSEKWVDAPIPFGEICLDFYNYYFDAAPESRRHDELMQELIKLNDGTDEDRRFISDLAQDNKKNLDLLKNVILKTDTSGISDMVKNSVWRLFCFLPCESWTKLILSQYTVDENNEYLYSNDYNNLVSIFHTQLFLDAGYITLINDTEMKCYASDAWPLLMYYDLHHLVFSDRKKEKVAVCQYCGHLFYSRSNNFKYCPDCSRKAIAAESRKNNPARYEHKKILDKLSQARNRKNNPVSEKDYQAFRKESNYHWAVVSGKQPPKVSRYAENIKTEDDYMAWLEKQKIKYSLKGKN